MLGEQANHMPLLDFGSLANANRAYHQLEGIPYVFRNSAGPRFRFFFWLFT